MRDARDARAMAWPDGAAEARDGRRGAVAEWRVGAFAAAAPWVQVAGTAGGGDVRAAVRLFNDTAAEALVTLERAPGAGVVLRMVGEGGEAFAAARLPPGGDELLEVCWAPARPGSVVRRAAFALDKRVRAELVVLGTAVRGAGDDAVGVHTAKRTAAEHTTSLPLSPGVAPAPSKRARRGRMQASSSAASTKRLSLRKPSSTSGVRQAVAAAATMRPSFAYFHSDMWMEKQERAYSRWLNQVLLSEGSGHRSGPMSRWEVQDARLAGASALRAEMWQMYSQREASAGGHSSIASSMRRVDEHVDGGKISVRRDVDLRGDPGVRLHLMTALMSYDPLWLAIAMDIAIGDAPLEVATHDSREAASSAVASYALNFVLYSPEVAARYSGRQEIEGISFKEELCRAALKKILLLVLLLDRAALAGVGGIGTLESGPRIGASMPPLFRPGASYSSSADVVASLAATPAGAAGSGTAVARAFLLGEGNLPRHLKFLGYSVHYEQPPAAGYDYRVTNLAEDMRDGVRLCRLAGVLTGDWSALTNAKVPANKQHQRVANVELALEVMRHAGMRDAGQGTINATSVVEGSRTVTLTLLWRIATTWQMPALAARDALRNEAARLRSLARDSPRAWYESRHAPLSPRCKEDCGEHAALLLEWGSAACAAHPTHPRVVANLGDAFADGTALATLISLYVPHLISGPDIATVRIDDGALPSTWSGGIGGAGAREEALECAATNNELVCKAVDALGGCASAVFETSGADVPDPRAVALQLAFLAERLLPLSAAERAATIIQCTWRAKKEREALPTRTAAALVIQRRWRAHAKRRGVAAATLQAHWRGHCVRATLRVTERATTILQAAWRSKMARRLLHHRFVVAPILATGVDAVQALKGVVAHRLAAATLIQATWRGTRIRRSVRVMKSAATRIQARWRAHAAAARFQKLREVVLEVQAAWRMGRALRVVVQADLDAAATAVQAAWRGRAVRLASSGDVLEARLALDRAVANARPEDTLWSRVTAALRTLEAHGALSSSEAALSCQVLEQGTLYSLKICELIASGPHAHRLLMVVRAAGRAAEHVHVVQAALHTLSNICHHAHLAERVARLPECGLVLAEKLQIYRDKAQVFCAACSVLECVARDPERANVLVRSDPKTPKRLGKLRTVLVKNAGADDTWLRNRGRARAQQQASAGGAAAPGAATDGPTLAPGITPHGVAARVRVANSSEQVVMLDRLLVLLSVVDSAAAGDGSGATPGHMKASAASRPRAALRDLTQCS